MHWKNWGSIICLCILFEMSMVGFCVAQPDITNVSGSFSHSGSVTVSGAGFGSKNPASPLLWDDGTSAPALGTRYDGWLPTSAQQGSQYSMAYRDTPFRSIDAPNPRVRYILGGAHATNTGSGAYNIGGNVALGKNITSHTYFISYYYRVDPNFDEENNPSYADNMKEIVLSNTQGSFYPDGWGAFGYADWCNSDVPDVNFRNPVKLGRMTIDPAHQSVPYACSGNNLVQHNSPINGWVKMQWEGVYNQQFDSPQYSLTTYPDGHRTYQSHYGDGLTFSETARGPWAGFPKENDLRFIGLGGFARVPRMNNGVNSFRYFAAVYMDSTHSRVMLGNNQDYAQCTIMEPQIPSSWNNTSIKLTANLGTLPDSGTAYLFVFDSGNVRNPVGYPVTLGGGQNNPPSPPTGLRVL